MDQRTTIEAARSGNRSDFDDLVRGFEGPVRRLVISRVRDPQAIEEIVQEVWWRAFRHLPSLEDAGRFEAWLARIARRCVADHFRRGRQSEPLEPLADTVPDRADATWVWEQVDQLEPDLRDVLVRRYREHRSYAEIAALLRVPVSTVRGRLYLARSALRRQLTASEMQG